MTMYSCETFLSWSGSGPVLFESGLAFRICNYFTSVRRRAATSFLICRLLHNQTENKTFWLYLVLLKTKKTIYLLFWHEIKFFFKMVLLTMIARQQDGLPLAASVQEDEQVILTFSNWKLNDSHFSLSDFQWCKTFRWTLKVRSVRFSEKAISTILDFFPPRYNAEGSSSICHE